MNETNFERFSAVYLESLRRAVAEKPEMYGPAVAADPTRCHANMMVAFRKGTYNHDGYAIKLACKTLGIKHTRKAIDAFLKGE